MSARRIHELAGLAGERRAGDRHGDGSSVLTCLSSRSISAGTLEGWVPGQALVVGTAAGRAVARNVVGCLFVPHVIRILSVRVCLPAVVSSLEMKCLVPGTYLP